MEAQEVLHRYAAGERNFCNANLRGANFKGQNLSEADFSGADIYSTNFMNANLRGANFAKTQAGLQLRWAIVQLLLVSVIAVVSSFVQGIPGWILPSYLDNSSFNSTGEGLTAGMIYLLLVSAVYAAILFQGFTILAFGSILTTFVVVVALTVAVAIADILVGGIASGTLAGAVTDALTRALALTVAAALIGALTVALVVIGAVALAVALTVAVAGVGIVTGAVALAVPVAVPVAGTVAGTVVTAGEGARAVAGASVVASLLFSIYVEWRVLKEDEKFDILRGSGLALAALGGTSFAGADLTGATFSQARLNSTNFADSRRSKTNFTHVCWKQADKLNRARLGSSILQDRRVRILLSEPTKGYKQDLTDANLRGANLRGVTLEQAILRRAILSDALLKDAVLEGAILTEAQAVNADFTGARLTGATLEAWNIDSTTTLKNIDCRYVFLRETPDARGSLERRPHNPDKMFQPGDFEKFFKEMPDEVQILIRNGVDPNAFRAALQNIMEQNPDITQDSVKAIEKQGADFLVTLQVPEGTNKAKVERDWDNGYQAGLKAGRDAGLLESAQEFKTFAALAVQRPITIHNQNRNQAMTGNDQSQNIDVKGDFTVTANNSVVSLRDTSGQVTNQITQLGDNPTQAQLKDMLAQLQAAIEEEPNLSEAEKTEALEEVKQIAAAGQAPQDGPMKKAAKRALTVLKGMTVGLGVTTQFVTACNGLLPAIALLFGL